MEMNRKVRHKSTVRWFLLLVDIYQNKKKQDFSKSFHLVGMYKYTQLEVPYDASNLGHADNMERVYP